MPANHPGSKRFRVREERELRRELLIAPYPELGLVAMDGPDDPEPSLVLEAGRITITGKASELATDDRVRQAYLG